jgi:O-6-methylguanine DNA methyltransferase
MAIHLEEAVAATNRPEFDPNAERPEGAATTVLVGQIETPLGVFGAALSPAGLGRLTFPDEPVSDCQTWARRWLPEAEIVDAAADTARATSEPAATGAFRVLARELNAYLAGNLYEFTVPVDLRGTPFQVRVWNALREIGYGEVRSYAAIAGAIGNPRAVRAVGMANGANPVPIVVPCHRVIGNDGTLTGYGGGLPLKERLLRLERAPGFAGAPYQPSLLDV